MPPDNFDNPLERGLRNRREILGDAWVDGASAGANAFNADFQAFITRYAWHEVWGRPGLAASTRRIIVLVSTASLGRWEEFELHCRAALSSADEASRLTPDVLKEVLLQLAIYAGVPAANTAVTHALKIMRELGMVLEPAALADSFHPGYGREACTRGPTSLHYTVREPASRAAPRHTFVLSHALGCDESMWDALASKLAADCRVVCYDHRGHGQSDRPAGPCSMAELAEDAVRVLEELGPEPVVWVGLSLGGMVGQELALRHPQRLKALVIANSCAGYDEAARAQWHQRIATVRARGMEEIADAALQRWFSAEFSERHPATLARARRRLVCTDAQAYAAACQAVSELDTLGRLPELRLPTLLIAGTQDQATPLAMSEAMAARIPGAQLHLLEGAAHLSVIEQPGPFHAALRGFLQKLDGSS